MMKVSREVIRDLLPAYLSGEASRDTVLLVEEFLATDPDLAREVARLREETRGALPQPAVPADLEKRAVHRTQLLLRYRSLFLGTAIFLTMLPLSFYADSSGIQWVLFKESPVLGTVSVAAAACCWVAYVLIRRRLRVRGL